MVHPGFPGCFSCCNGRSIKPCRTAVYNRERNETPEKSRQLKTLPRRFSLGGSGPKETPGTPTFEPDSTRRFSAGDPEIPGRTENVPAYRNRTKRMLPNLPIARTYLVIGCSQKHEEQMVRFRKRRRVQAKRQLAIWADSTTTTEVPCVPRHARRQPRLGSTSDWTITTPRRDYTASEQNCTLTPNPSP